MSVELKKAARQALDLSAPTLRELVTRHAVAIDPRATLEDMPEALAFQIDMARALLKEFTAIQQAESEPVGFVDFQGTVFWHEGPPPADSLLFASKPVSHDKAKWCEYVAGMVFAWLEMQENLKEEDRCIKAITGIIERRMWALPTTHPAPGVPEGFALVPLKATPKVAMVLYEGARSCFSPKVAEGLWQDALTAAQAQKGQQ